MPALDREMTKNSVISIVLVFLICGCCGMAENKSLDADKAIWQRHRKLAKARGTPLSEKARGFVTSVRDDGSSFLLYVFRGGHGPQRSIALFTGKRPAGFPHSVEISRSEAIRIVDFFAGKGILDKNGGFPCGKVVGWYLTLSTGRDHHIARFLGVGRQALLGRPDVLGVRGVLGSKTAKKWDAFVDQVRAEVADKKKVEANSQ